MRAKSSKQRCPALCKHSLFNRLRAILPKGYQRGSLGRVTRTATTSKQAMRKSCLPAGIEPAASKHHN